MRRLAIDQQGSIVFGVGPDDKIEQRLALRTEQACPARQGSVDIAGYQSLEESAHVVARQSQQRTVGEMCLRLGLGAGLGHDH